VRDPRANERDEALRRLRRTTSVALAAAGALAAGFAGLAAKALPGHQSVKKPQVRVRGTAARATPPPLVPVQNAGVPAAPASPPVSSQAPPVVSSGGT